MNEQPSLKARRRDEEGEVGDKVSDEWRSMCLRVQKRKIDHGQEICPEDDNIRTRSKSATNEGAAVPGSIGGGGGVYEVVVVLILMLPHDAF